MGDLTAANAVLTLSQPILFPTPQQIQGFAADDVFDLDEIESIETLMGVDGVLSFGFVWKPQMQNIILQADSPSGPNFFDIVQLHQQSENSAYPLDGVIILPAIGMKIILTNGGLTGYKLPGAKKLIQPRRFRITWNLALPAPV